MSRSVVIAGSVAQRPGYGGHTWVFLQYLLGFRRLGWDVLFVDRLEPDMCVDEVGNPCPLEDSVNLQYLLDVLAKSGLEQAYALLYDHGRRVLGLPRTEVVERTRRSALLLNVMGFLDDEDILGQAQRRVFLDIDPGFGQMWQALGLHGLFHGHDDYVTIGQNIGQAECTVPTCGIEWTTTSQPVVLEHWPTRPLVEASFTSVGSWRGPFAPLEYEGSTYGLRAHEFRRFLEVPRLTGHPFEIALDIDETEVADLDALRRSGWLLVDARQAAGTPSTYQRFVQDSKGEFMVAKNMYVQSRSGWFSDRSICYLASGKPVLAQDTGFAGTYPVGEGLLTFRTVEEAAAGVEEISRDYAHHSCAARALAEGYFDSDKVLSRLLEKLRIA